MVDHLDKSMTGMDTKLHNINTASYGPNDWYTNQLQVALNNATDELKYLADIILAKDKLIVRKDKLIATLISQLYACPSSLVPTAALSVLST
jgi:hypothetical protein